MFSRILAILWSFVALRMILHIESLVAPFIVPLDAVFWGPTPARAASWPSGQRPEVDLTPQRKRQVLAKTHRVARSPLFRRPLGDS